MHITIGFALSLVLIGIPILVRWFVWSLIRIVNCIIAVAP
jgi:hypothetical protein